MQICSCLSLLSCTALFFLLSWSSFLMTDFRCALFDRPVSAQKKCSAAARGALIANIGCAFGKNLLPRGWRKKSPPPPLHMLAHRRRVQRARPHCSSFLRRPACPHVSLGPCGLSSRMLQLYFLVVVQFLFLIIR